MKEVESNNINGALQYLKDGGKLCIPTYTHMTILTKKTLEKFEKAGCYLLKEDGNGYRLKRGHSSVFLFAGQLKYMD